MRLSASLGSKNLKKVVQNELKLKSRPGTHSALLECRMVLSKCRMAQIRASARGHLN